MQGILQEHKIARATRTTALPDLFVVRTISFKLLYGLVILRHARSVPLNLTGDRRSPQKAPQSHSWPTKTRSSASVTGWQSRRTTIFWHTCPALTERWRQAIFTLPPSVLQELAIEVQHLEAVTKLTNQELHAARLGAIADGDLVEVLLDRALASMELLNEAADTMTRLLDELLKT
jgi:hypothetical protein